MVMSIQDRYGPDNGNGYPPPDNVQNYELLNGMKNQTHITVTFRRKLSTCDPNDWTITVTTSGAPCSVFNKLAVKV